MNKEELFKAFVALFPNWETSVISYKKIGSKTLAIKFSRQSLLEETDQNDTEISRVFLYIDPNNWQFGTKLWRKRPDKLQKKDPLMEGDELNEEKDS